MKDAQKKAMLITALYAWIAQRPGLEFGNYGDVSAYRSELRRITKDGRDARELLRAVEMSGITYKALQAAVQSAYSGRLTWNGKRLDYCTGQYWPTEYRAAVAAVCSQALWGYYREDAEKEAAAKGVSIGDAIRGKFRRMFGRAMQRRWFD